MRLRNQVQLWAQERLSVCELCVTQEMNCDIVWGMWWNGTDGIVCVLMLLSQWHCLWTSNGLPMLSVIGYGAVVGVSWPFLASGQHQNNTSSSICHILVADMIKYLKSIQRQTLIWYTVE